MIRQKSNELSELQKIIDEKRIEMAELMRKKKIIKSEIESLLLPEKIANQEQLYPDGCKWAIESCVLKNETYDEWFERVIKKCKYKWEHGSCRTEFGKGSLKDGSPYLKWLVAINDQRIINTKYYDLNKL